MVSITLPIADEIWPMAVSTASVTSFFNNFLVVFIQHN